MKKAICFMAFMAAASFSYAQGLKLNDLEYFERKGVNVLVFSNSFNGGFNDEKNSGIEIIHHGVRTVQGGAVRLNNTPEQWDLVPKMTSRKVDRETGSIEVNVQFNFYLHNSVSPPWNDEAIIKEGRTLCKVLVASCVTLTHLRMGARP